jgi:hypothetical protein
VCVCWCGGEWWSLTWLASIYKSRLYAAPITAVLVTTPLALTIFLFNGNIRYNLGTYCIKTIKERRLFVWLALLLLKPGITHQITTWNVQKICQNDMMLEISIKKFSHHQKMSIDTTNKLHKKSWQYIWEYYVRNYHPILNLSPKVFMLFFLK